MRERQRRNPALVERRPVSGTGVPMPQLSNDDPEVDGLKRRLRAFNEDGVTVLSNRRREVAAPVSPEVIRVAAASAVTRPEPEPLADPEQEQDAEQDPESDEPLAVVEEPQVETRSLRPRSSSSAPASRRVEDTTPQWPAWLAVCAALGLVVVWLRKRRAGPPASSSSS